MENETIDLKEKIERNLERRKDGEFDIIAFWWII